jgi:hypothetical protein
MCRFVHEFREIVKVPFVITAIEHRPRAASRHKTRQKIEINFNFTLNCIINLLFYHINSPRPQSEKNSLQKKIASFFKIKLRSDEHFHCRTLAEGSITTEKLEAARIAQSQKVDVSHPSVPLLQQYLSLSHDITTTSLSFEISLMISDL